MMAVEAEICFEKHLMMAGWGRNMLWKGKVKVKNNK
jgi:hypothetical protein